MRGRLINAFEVDLAQLDTTATEADPDGPGPLPSGYDPDFGEVVVHTDPVDGDRESARKETHRRLPCQVEIGNNLEALQEMIGGDSPDSTMTLVFHFATLERLGMVDPATGEAMIRKGDRLHAIYERCTGKLVQIFRNPPGLFATKVVGTSYGIGRSRNLLLVTFEDREQGVRGAA